MFFEQSQVEIARALETPRPVSAWQNAMVINADGTQGADFNRLVDSHIKASVAEDISSVILMSIRRRPAEQRLASWPTTLP